MTKSPSKKDVLNETEIMMALIEDAEAPGCANLHALLSEKRKRFPFPPPFVQLPLNGVYFIFEKGQTSHGHPRIVRIGSHTGRDRLTARLWEHTIPHGRSFFRYDLGKVIIEYPQAIGIEPISKEIWRGERSQLETLADRQALDLFEVELSAFIEQRFEFSVIGTSDPTEALALERECIATVAQCDVCKKESETSVLKPPHGHVWNRQHAGGKSKLSASSFQLLTHLASEPLGAVN